MILGCMNDQGKDRKPERINIWFKQFVTFSLEID